MRNILLSMAVACLLLCPLSVSVPAQGGEPSRREQLVMKDTLLVLWSMGLSRTAPVDEAALCRNALFFLILSEGAACGLDRDAHPDAFTGIAEAYAGRVPKEKVEEAARAVFNQDVRRHVAPVGTFFDGRGYFLDFSALSETTGNLCHLSSEDLLPGYASVDVMDAVDENTVKMHGWLRRFKEVDGEEIVWKAATFAATFRRAGAVWTLTAFTLKEEAMG